MIAFIADIHANWEALRAVLRKIDEEGIREIVSLGDVCGYGPAINECCGELRERGILNLMGNHDLLLKTGESCGRSRSVDYAIAYQRGIITKENYDWVCASADCLRTEQFFACHGGPEDYIDQYLREPPYALDESTGLFVSGHTHMQVLWEKDGLRYLNPGAVGQPRDGDPRAAYAVLKDDGTAELRRVEYDIDAAAEAYRNAGFPEKFWECLYRGAGIGSAK